MVTSDTEIKLGCRHKKRLVFDEPFLSGTGSDQAEIVKNLRRKSLIKPFPSLALDEAAIPVPRSFSSKRDPRGSRHHRLLGFAWSHRPRPIRAVELRASSQPPHLP